MIEFVEWACRTYGWTVDEVVEMPLSHLAMLWRCNAHGSGRNKSGTFEEDDLSARLANLAKEV